jgi:hypothetical protein
MQCLCRGACTGDHDNSLVSSSAQYIQEKWKIKLSSRGPPLEDRQLNMKDPLHHHTCINASSYVVLFIGKTEGIAVLLRNLPGGGHMYALNVNLITKAERSREQIRWEKKPRGII